MAARTAADRMCAVARYYDISSKKQIVETFLSSTIKNHHMEHPYSRQKSQTGGTGPQGHFTVWPQRGNPPFVHTTGPECKDNLR